MRLVLNVPPGEPAAPTLLYDDAAPKPEPGRVVVRIEWAGLNRIDQLLADGQVPRPAGEHILGGQGSGRVWATGSGADNLERGQLVTLYPYGGCGACERCATGNETPCREARLDGVNAPGMLQSYFLARARDAVPVPARIGARMAALAPTVAVAWHVLVCRGGLRPGDTVAVASISSGLGACCGAVADLLGADVVGVARRATLERLRVVPAWLTETWDSDESGSGGSMPRVDLAVDAVGAPTLPIVHRMVRTGGRMVTVGAHAGRQCSLDLWRLFTREQDLRGSHGCHRADMDHAVEALSRLDEGDLVDSVFDVADYRAAYERLDTPGRLGNVLIAMGGSADSGGRCRPDCQPLLR
jgi:D-arabinose 1-dehydrogenase-like Zn-dependent alcohol dehydrogenase